MPSEHVMVVWLIPLAVWILISGLDDLFVGLVFVFHRRKRFAWPADGELEKAAERRIAIFIPLWHEHRVIGQMLERNVGGIRYGNYDLFAGVYPNDHQTARAVAQAERQYGRVHMVVLPHDGPTSKGDCLNWIYHGMEDYEAAHGVRFDVVVTHDAEDTIHPEALRYINWYSGEHAMVQVPVLALPTPIREFTHGIYCDEFAEFQLKDIPVRQRLGGFLPSNGVGCGFSREALEKLAEGRGGLIFDPGCLTEDYENGFRIHALGLPQIFVPLRLTGKQPVATREYFPRKVRSAMRQRSRWVLGITLQGWQHFGWRAPWKQRYWLWRDRKGLVGNMLSPVANLTFIYGLIRGHWLTRGPHGMAYLYAATLSITVFQTLMRAECCAQIYGWRYAAFVPLRVLWGNVINFSATYQALNQFVKARIQRGKLTWRKTEHCYPLHQANDDGRARLGEVLVRMRCMTLGDVEEAVRSLPEGVRLGEYLMNLQKVSEDHVYQALSSQAGIPLGTPPTDEVSRMATRMLPAETVRRWKVLPYRVDLGQLHLVTPEVPSEAMARELSQVSTLELRFRLIRPGDFARMTGEYFPAA